MKWDASAYSAVKFQGKRSSGGTDGRGNIASAGTNGSPHTPRTSRSRPRRTPRSNPTQKTNAPFDKSGKLDSRASTPMPAPLQSEFGKSCGLRALVLIAQRARAPRHAPANQRRYPRLRRGPSHRNARHRNWHPRTNTAYR